MQNLKSGNAQDVALAKTISHEFFRCELAFNNFTKFAEDNIIRKKDTRREMSTSYLDFLQHLYEFYIGCFKRDAQNLDPISKEKKDKTFNYEVERLLRNRREAIEKGYAPKWENSLSYYQIAVPEKFGEHFRLIRNRSAHVEIGRVSDKDLSVFSFFRKYHRFIYLLFKSGRDWWHNPKPDTYNWDNLSNFDFNFKEDANTNLK